VGVRQVAYENPEPTVPAPRDRGVVNVDDAREAEIEMRTVEHVDARLDRAAGAAPRVGPADVEPRDRDRGAVADLDDRATAILAGLQRLRRTDRRLPGRQAREPKVLPDGDLLAVGTAQNPDLVPRLRCIDRCLDRSILARHNTCAYGRGGRLGVEPRDGLR
jgi:hypothetical protein